MRKLLFAIMFVCFGWMPHAHADKMVNVEYIHKLIKQRWDITIPYSPKLSTPKVAANMKYLLTLVDMTNRRINGTATTDYGNGEFATMVAADTVAANTAITKLARIKPKFTITTTPDTTEFKFQITATGRFMVDWGDNTATEIVRNKTGWETYSHTYKKPGEYKIKMTGRATGYSYETSSVSFRNNTNIAKIDGSLGAIFGTIGDGASILKQPGFTGTFDNCTNLSGKIPADLFAGVHGTPRDSMFRGTFGGCTSLDGPIPPTLFSGISGAPAAEMFHSTFYGDGKLSGPIPAGLFGNISGNPAKYMFYGTFYNCSNLSGEIPADMFGDIYGAPAENMFDVTFLNCSNLTGSIPAGLFGNIYGDPAKDMFRSTFVGCKKLTGCVPDGLYGDITGMTQDELLAQYGTFSMSGITKEYCSALAPKFTVTVRVGDTEIGTDTNEFKFKISAQGLFKIDWGDGKSEIINRTNTNMTIYSHEYDAPGEYKIGIGGYATRYNGAAILFGSAYNDITKEAVVGISGSLGAIFPTIGDGAEPGQQPAFNSLFTYCKNLSGPIPENLFTGIHGAPVANMFRETFFECGKLTGKIPAGLFGALSGAPKYRMFYSTFLNDSKISGEIPAGLLGNLSGEPAEDMFYGMFANCSGLTGCVPNGLFGDIGMTLDEIIANTNPFGGTKITREYCPVDSTSE